MSEMDGELKRLGRKYHELIVNEVLPPSKRQEFLAASQASPWKPSLN